MVDHSGHGCDRVAGKETKRGERPIALDRGIRGSRQYLSDLFPPELLLYTQNARQDLKCDNSCRFWRSRHWFWFDCQCCGGHLHPGVSRKFLRFATAATATIAITNPFAEIAENETPV